MLKNSLNDIQRNAVISDDEVIVIRAGAGSGKTRVITHRVAYLIREKKVKPSEIVCVTFTNKAAREMLERIKTMLAEDNLSEMPVVTTFHSYSLSLIRRFGSIKNYSHFSIMNDDDQLALIKRIMQEYGSSDKEFTPRAILSYIGSVKNGFLQSALDYPQEKKLQLDTFYQLYEREKYNCHAFDFDDLLIKALELIKEPHIKMILQSMISHVLVDEYQDTNIVQHNMIRELAYDNDKKFALKSLCIVGDEDQAIYSWRGANSHNITYFKKDFPQAKDILLTQNYRSSDLIVSLANTVISKNKERIPKDLWSERSSANMVTVINYSNGYSEAEGTIKMIQHLRAKDISSIAILYRSHFQSRLFEEYCVTYSIPYRVLGGINFYERQEIKDILSYATIAINGRSRIAFMRCCNTPERGLGEAFIANFMEFWNKHDSEDILEVIGAFLSEHKMTQKARTGLLFVMETIVKIRDLVNEPHKALKCIIDETNYNHYIVEKSDDPQEITTRKENISELLEAALTFEKLHESSLSDFLDHISLMYEREDTKNSSQHVILMTLHAAKGLEFSTVFLVGMEEGVFPSARSYGMHGVCEEERRLLYVGITRACDRLICSYARQRTLWGSTRLQSRSCFFDDFNGDSIVWLDVSSMPGYMVERTLHKAIDNQMEKQKDSYIKNAATFTAPIRPKLSESISNNEKNKSSFKPAQKVEHSVFGQGVVLVVEKEYCMVKFPQGVKKIKSEFLI